MRFSPSTLPGADSAAGPPPEPERALGRFRALAVLGRGGFGRVWKVVDPLRAGQVFALKLLDLSRAKVETLRAREFRVGATIRHPVLVPVVESGLLEPGREPYLLSEFVDGVPLEPPWDEHDLVPLAVELLDALGALHAAGWRHGDLQPRNILVAGDAKRRPRVRLLDFGLARSLAEYDDRCPGGGVPRYFAPETLRGEAADHRADLYALGLILFECLRGRIARAVSDHLVRTRQGTFHAEVCAADLPASFAPLLRALLEPDPRRRPANAAEAISLLPDGEEAPPEGKGVEWVVPSFEAPAPVGNADLLARLDDAVAARRRRSSLALFLIEGEAGGGKTRLLREAVIAAMLAGLRSLSWDMALASVAAAAHPADARLQSPALRGTGDDGLDLAADVHAARLVAALSKETTLLVIDDYDRRSAAERALIDGVVERLITRVERRHSRPPASSSTIVLMSARPLSGAEPAARARWLRLAALPWSTVHRLRRWTAAEDDVYLDRVLAPRRDLGANEPLLRRQARGVPGRWQTLLRGLARRGVLRFESGGWTCRDASLVIGEDLPGECELFRASWEFISPEARQLLGAASLAGAPRASFPLRSLAHALDLPFASCDVWESELDSVPLQSGLDAAFARSEPRTPLLSRHERAWILRAGGARWRRRLREQVARAASLGAESLYQRVRLGEADIAAVLASPRDELGERILKAFAMSSSAERSARARSALELAERLERRGLVSRARVAAGWARSLAVEPATRAKATFLLAECKSAAGDSTEAERLYEECLPRLERHELFARALLGHAIHAFRGGDLDEARRRSEDAIARVNDAGPFQNLLGNIALAAGELARAGELLEAAVASAERHEAAADAAVAATNLARVRMRGGELDEAVHLLEKAAGDFARCGRRAQEALALGNLAAVRRRRGEHDLALEALQRSLAIYREHGDDGGVALQLASLGILARDLGLPGTAARRFRAALDAARTAGAPVRRRLESDLTLLENRALLALDLGDVDEALRLRTRARQSDSLAALQLRVDGLLLEARLLAGGLAGGGPDFRSTVDGRAPFQAEDALWIVELALAGGAERQGEARGRDGELGAVVHAARVALDDLRSRSRLGAFCWSLVEVARRGPCAAEATAFLRREVAGEPRRELRRRALVLLVRSPGDGDKNGDERRQLRQLLDEVLVDLSPGERDRFRAGREIQEALAVARTTSEGALRDAGVTEVLGEVFRFSREILVEKDVTALLRKIVDAAMALTGAQRGVLCLRRSGGVRVAVARRRGEEGRTSDLDNPEAQMSRTILEQTLREGSARVASNALEEEGLRSIDSVEELGLRSVICVPLVAQRGKTLGVLYLDNPLQKGIFGTSQLELVENFCAQAVLAWTAAEQRRERERLVAELREAQRTLRDDLDAARREVRRRASQDTKQFAGMIGSSRPMRELFRWIEVVGPTELPVLICGESGAGKELVARAMYQLSKRAHEAFVAENCAAIPGGLIESVFFGHKKGAFTGADANRRGIFELAHGGTLFLDEIGELPLDTQASLLRVLQEGEVRPLGSDAVVKVDVRVIAASNRDVRREVDDGRFREDLFYRLQGAEIRVPALRERPEDIPLLVESILARAAPQGQAPKRLGPDAMECLVRYPWPGNVRELENEVRRAAVIAPTGVIGVELLPPHVRDGVSRRELGNEPVRTLEDIEREAILNALSHFDGHRRKAAKALGISRSTLYLKLKAMGYL